MRMVMVAIAALACPAPAGAQNPPASSTDERRLTPQQIEAILAEAAAKRGAAERQIAATDVSIDQAEPKVARPAHGEVGISIGTGGYREIFGTTIVPLGDEGVAAISLDMIDWGNRRHKR